MIYQIKCAWCGKQIGTKEGAENSLALRMETHGLPIISHGMCESCKKKTMDEIPDYKGFAVAQCPERNGKFS